MINKEKIFYIYAYLDPRKPGDYNYGSYHFDYEPFLIGKGSYNRLFDHLNEKEETTYNPYKVRKINKIKTTLNIDPIIIKLFENLEKEESYKIEVEIIDIIGRYNKGVGPLTNLTDGGKGSRGYKWTDVMRRNKSNSMLGKNNSFFGKKHTEDQIKKWSINKSGENHPNWGKNLNKETIEKMRNSAIGKKKTDQHRKNISISKMGDKNPNWGKIKSNITCEKISKSLKNKERFNSKVVFLYDNNLELIKKYTSLIELHLEYQSYSYPRLNMNINANSKSIIKKYATLDKKYILSYKELNKK